MIKIGLTGNIGSGKTTVSKIFKELGIPVFNSDTCAREAENEIHIQEGFRAILGDDIYVDGVLDRPKMRSLVFVDKAKLKEVNDLVIPYVKQQFEIFCEESKYWSPIVMLESAILFETGGNKIFDYIITVTANENTRILRAQRRDNSSLEDIKNKLNNQWREEAKVTHSNFVVVNEGYDLLDSLPILRIQALTIQKAIAFEVLTKGLQELTNMVKKNY